MNSVHTPLPWRIVDDGRWQQVKIWSADRCVAVDQHRGNAELIVSAVNSRNDLIAALKELIALDDGDNTGLWGYEPIFEQARAAIAKAES